MLVLWLGRLAPILFVFTLPVFAQADSELASHPDAPRLLDPAGDESGFAHAWLADFERTDLSDFRGTLFWLVCFSWAFVAVLAGGITARLVHGEGASGLFLAECGRYAGRFLRLGIVAAALCYVADVGVNALLADAHETAGRVHFTQDFAIERSHVRGALFLTLLAIIGAIHAYARIDIVSYERRSAVLSFLRGLATLLARLPKLLVLEVAMLLAAGAAALLAWVLSRVVVPLRPDSTWLVVGIFLAAAAVGSYLRTGIELGTLEARCRLLAPVAPEVTVYRSETPEPQTGDDSGELELPPVG